MASRTVPLDNQARMRTRPGGEPRVAAKVLLRQVQALRGWVDAGSTQPVPQLSKCKQQPERNIRSISAHVYLARRMKSESLSAPASRRADSTPVQTDLCKPSIADIDPRHSHFLGR